MALLAKSGSPDRTYRLSNRTAQTYQSNLNRQRAGDIQRNDYHQHIAKFERFEGNKYSDDLVEAKRYQSRYRQQNAELQVEEKLRRAAIEKQQRGQLVEQDNIMAAAMWDLKHERESKALNERYVIEENDELRELKRKIHAAKTSSERAQHQIYAAQLAQQRDRDEQRQDQMMEDTRQQGVRRAEEQRQHRLQANVQGKYALQNQMVEKEQKKHQAYLDGLREKAQVDTVVAELEAEDRLRKELIKKSKTKIWNEVQVFISDRKKFFVFEEERAKQELVSIAAYEKQQEERRRQIHEQKQQSVEQRDFMLKKLSDEINAKRKEAEEFRSLLLELYQSEAERRAEEEIARREANDRARIEEFKVANKVHLRERELERQEREREQEEEHRQLVEQFAMNARLEELNNADRKRRLIEFRREAEKLIEEKQRKYEEEMAYDFKQRQIAAERERLKQEIIKRERIRLLQENAVHLRRYLPKTMFSSPEDVEAVWGTSDFGATNFSQTGGGDGGAAVDYSSGLQAQMTSQFAASAFSPSGYTMQPMTSEAQGAYTQKLNTVNYNRNYPTAVAHPHRSPTAAQRGSSPSSRFSSSLRFAGSTSLGAGSPTSRGGR